MLWGIDPLLTADLLYALRRMGHGDEVVVVDANFPADSTATTTVMGEPIPLAGVNAARAVEAILSVMPLSRLISAWGPVTSKVASSVRSGSACQSPVRLNRLRGRRASSSLVEASIASALWLSAQLLTATRDLTI